MAYSNSPLVEHTRISPNKTTSNRKPIDRITIHHAAGNILVESMGEMFSRAAQRSSSNYGIGTNGKIAMYVEEAHSSWCSSSTANDTRAVTIEVANSSNNDPNWPVSDMALEATIKLCADICKRNGKKKMVYFADKNTALAYTPKSDEMLLTRHDFFKQKTCLPMETELFTPDGWVELADIEIGDIVATCILEDGQEVPFFTFSPVLDIVEPRDEVVYTNQFFTGTKDHEIAVMMTKDDKNTKGMYMLSVEDIMKAQDKGKQVCEIVNKGESSDYSLMMNMVAIPASYIEHGMSKDTICSVPTNIIKFGANEFTKVGKTKVGCVTVKSGKIVIKPGRVFPNTNDEVALIVSNCPGPYLGGKLPYIVDRVNILLSGETKPSSNVGSISVSGVIIDSDLTTGTGITPAIRANMRYGKLTDKTGQDIQVPDGLGTVNTYMHWQKIKSDSLQRDLRTAAGMKFDDNGYAKIDDRYVIAMTDTFGQVGDKVDIHRDGSLLKAIIGDIKDQTTAHGPAANKWGHDNGQSIIEFITDEKWVKSQSQIYSTDPGKERGAVLHVTNKGNWFLEHEDEDPLRFPYLVRVTDDALNIRQGPGTNYPVIGVIEDKGVYTILAESTGQGAKLWGQLKPVMSNGWISLGFTQKL